jgi:hypothetical protein
MDFLSLLQILFIGLKLTNHIDWSWFYVLLPLIVVSITTITVLKDDEELKQIVIYLLKRYFSKDKR